MAPLIQHAGLESTWPTYSLAYQMANIGSEVSRSIKNQDKPTRFQGAYDRALELFDLTIFCLSHDPDHSLRLREVCRAREEFCDYFAGNSLGTDPAQMQKYYDSFTSLLH